MTERPILFTAEMVRALQRGKTQTRRAVNWKRIAKQSGCTQGKLAWSKLLDSWAVFNGNGEADLCAVTCPYGRAGDRLWVKETWRVMLDDNSRPFIEYRADNSWVFIDIDDPIDAFGCAGLMRPNDPWRSPRFMPKIAARYWLELVNVRLQRVQDISEGDARSEGAMYHDGGGIGHSGWRHDYKDVFPCARASFFCLWDTINAKRGYPVSANPEVWVLTFKRSEKP